MKRIEITIISQCSKNQTPAISLLNFFDEQKKHVISRYPKYKRVRKTKLK